MPTRAATRPRRTPAGLLGSLVAAGYRATHPRPLLPPPPAPPTPPTSPAAAGGPGDGAAGVRRLTLADDASHLSTEPGSYEWWNFFGASTDPTEPPLAVSAIFMPANLFDTRYRRAVHQHRHTPGVPPPEPSAFPLLQVNVAHRGRKVFTTVRNPPGTTTEFALDRPAGRIGASRFEADVAAGVTTYTVHLDLPDMTNLKALEGELRFSSPHGGWAFGGAGLYAPIPGGDRHQWQFPLTLPEVAGHLRVVDRRGRTRFEAELAGTGYTDHCWGAGLTGDVLESWTFGRADLGPAGAAIAIWLVPRARPGAEPGADVTPDNAAGGGYGRVLRLHPDGTVVCHEAVELVARHPWRGALGLPYHGEVTFRLRDGSLRMCFPRHLGEDWPFQVSGEGRFDVEIAGDVTAHDAPGPVEHLSQPRIDDPFFGFLDGLVPRIPFVGGERRR